MKKSFLFALAFFSCVFVFSQNSTAQTVSQSANQQLAAWRTFAPANEKFRIQLPQEPSGATDYEYTDLFKARAYELKMNSTAFLVGYIEFGGNTEAQNFLKQNWNEIWNAAGAKLREVAKEKSNFWLVADKNVAQGIYNGREIVIEAGTVTGRTRYYLVKNRLYVVAMMMPTLVNAPAALAKIYQAEAEQFFNSFQIADNKTVEIARNKK
jgi:hypothetical protein